MKRSKLHATLLGSTPDTVGPALYEAVHRVDLLQLMNCWSEDEDRVWFLLGQGPMTGDGPIRASFVSIFINASLQVFGATRPYGSAFGKFRSPFAGKRRSHHTVRSLASLCDRQQRQSHDTSRLAHGGRSCMPWYTQTCF